MIAFTSSGTGGHIYPCIALAEELPENEFYFICSKDRKDREIINKYGFNFSAIASERKNLLKIFSNFFKARGILKQHKTKVLVSSGGYFTFPVVLAAASLRIPIFLLEQNILPGRVNRYLAMFATKIFISFPEAAKHFPRKKTVFSGNPIRNFNLKDETYNNLLKIDLPKNYYTVLIFGGSQGALAINKLFFDNYDYFLDKDFFLIQVTGSSFYHQVTKKYPKEAKENKDFLIIANNKGENKIIVIPYFENMAYLYETADLVIARSGATTVSELEAFQKQAILIPFPFAKDNHQFYNAKFYEKLRLGKLILESDLSFELLLNKINEFKMNKDQQKVDNNFLPNKAKVIILDYLKNW